TEWKNAVARERLDPKYPNRVHLPEGMVSGYYKYIVFGRLERSTGRVYDEPCHRALGHQVALPNTDWVAQNHSCAPLYYRPATRQASLRAAAEGEFWSRAARASSARTSSTPCTRRDTSRSFSTSCTRPMTRRPRYKP